MEIENDRLVEDGTGILRRPSDNHGGIIEPKFIVIHYTAGGSAQSSIDAMARNRLSAHLVVDRDGTTYQLVDFNRKAWHAGKSFWRGYFNLNSHSVGIEVCNYGWLLPQGDGTFKRPGETPVFSGNQVHVGDHKNGWPRGYGWELYMDEQIGRVSDLCGALLDYYPSIKGIVGHDEIAPDRKQDPGPAFPIDSLRSRMEGRRPNEGSDVYEVVARSGLILRAGPSGNDSVVRVLAFGTRVYLLGGAAGYVPVSLEDDGVIDGFVHRDWLRLV
jgi:N-acetylmuramoyl-L-alanine amidase